jgi:hypothetical protein
MERITSSAETVLAALELDVHAADHVVERFHRVAEVEVHTVLHEGFVQQLRHFKVDRGHDLVERLDEADLEPRVAEVFRHLQPDEAAADNGSALDAPARARARGRGRYPARSRASARARSRCREWGA